MTKRYLWNWGVWIGVVSGIYCYLYTLTPLNDYGVMCATFTSLPIFFTGGAQGKEFLNYACSNVVGALWALAYLAMIVWIVPWGGAALANGLSVGLLTIIVMGVHFIPLGQTWMNKPAAMFGAISSTFWIGGDTKKFIPLVITLILGVTLAYICQAGTKFLTEDGHWTRPSKKEAAATK